MKTVSAVLLALCCLFAPAGRHLQDDVADARVVLAPLGTQPYGTGAFKQAQFSPDDASDPVVDGFGVRHIRYRQSYKGLPVIGADMVEHHHHDRVIRTGRTALVGNLDIQPGLSETDARALVTAAYGVRPFSARLAVLPLRTGSRLVWHFDEQGFDSRWQVMVDAHTGKVLNAYDNIQHGTGIGVLGDLKTLDTTFNGTAYEMISSDGKYKTINDDTGMVCTDSDDFWTDGAAVDAHFHADLTLDYYLEQFGRDSYDGNGAQLVSRVHYGTNYVNAFWNGAQMIYGDGDGTYVLDFPGAFDVVVHEITHGVTEHTSNLIYQNESGALNEAFSDIMAAAAEYYKQNSQWDWKIAEDIWTPSIPGDALRYMDNPTLDGTSRDHYDDRYIGTADNGGVHYNSGIANLAFKLSCVGGSHPTYGGTYSGVGFDVATQVFYIAFTQYLSSSATFEDARAACVAVAGLYYDSATADIINEAWGAVGVRDPNGPTVISVPPATLFESAHPYANDENTIWEISAPGATSITVNFKYLDVERGYDYIYVLDGADNVVATYTGRYLKGSRVTVPGDVARVHLVTDYIVTRNGFVATTIVN